jgi:hypothetical protein
VVLPHYLPANGIFSQVFKDFFTRKKQRNVFSTLRNKTRQKIYSGGQDLATFLFLQPGHDH